MAKKKSNASVIEGSEKVKTEAKIEVKEEPKKGPGQPTKFSEANVKMIKFMALKGATDKEMAEVLGVTEQTVNNWKKDQPEFFESLKDWKIEADREVERSLFERAKGYSCKETKLFCWEGMIVDEEITKHYPPDPTSMIFWLKNRQPKVWRDRIENANMNQGENETYEDYITRISSMENKNERRD